MYYNNNYNSLYINLNDFELIKEELCEDTKNKILDNINREKLLTYQIGILNEKLRTVVDDLKNSNIEVKALANFKKSEEIICNLNKIINSWQLHRETNQGDNLKTLSFIQNKTFALILYEIKNEYDYSAHIHFRLNSTYLVGKDFSELNYTKYNILHFVYKDNLEDYNKNIAIIKKFFEVNFFTEIKPSLPKEIQLKRNQIPIIKLFNRITKVVLEDYIISDEIITKRTLRESLLEFGFPEDKLDISV